MIADFTEVNAVTQQGKEVLLIDAAPQSLPAGLGDPCLGGMPFDIQFADESRSRAMLGVAAEDVTYQRSFTVVDDELAFDHVVSERRDSAHPHAFGLAGGDLVADAFAGDLAFELRE